MESVIFTPAFVYSIVFLAFVLPVGLWRLLADNEPVGGTANSVQKKLPPLFAMLDGVSSTLEFPLGVPLAKIFSDRRAKYANLIRIASLPLTPEKVLVDEVLLSLGSLVAGGMLFLVPDIIKPAWALAAVAFMVFTGWAYPGITLQKYVEWRQGELTRALPFAIDLIGSAMRAGLEFGAAMRYFVSLKMGGPLEEEFASVLHSVELGKTRSEALKEMADRIQVDSFTSFAGVVAYGTEIGASISDTLEVHGEELRRSRFHLAERKAARAPSLMILPMAVFIMPAVFIIIITPVMIQMKASGVGSHG